MFWERATLLRNTVFQSVKRGQLALLGILACLWMPVATYAGQDDAPVTLRMKFKLGETRRYKTVQKMNIKMDIPEGSPYQMTTTTSLTQDHKVVRLRPDGGGVVKATTKSMRVVVSGAERVVVNGAKQPAGAVPVITTERDTRGKIIRLGGLEKTGDPGVDAMSQIFGGSGASGFGSYLPEKPVKVGDSWENEITLPDMLGKGAGTMKCTLVRMETVGKYQTARIHTELSVPMSIMIGKSGQLTVLATEAMMIMDGTLIATSDVNFAIEEGIVLRSIERNKGDFTMKPNEEAKANAPTLPDSVKMNIQVDEEITLLPPPSPATPKTPKLPVKSKKRAETSRNGNVSDGLC